MHLVLIKTRKRKSPSRKIGLEMILLLMKMSQMEKMRVMMIMRMAVMMKKRIVLRKKKMRVMKTKRKISFLI